MNTRSLLRGVVEDDSEFDPAARLLGAAVTVEASDTLQPKNHRVTYTTVDWHGRRTVKVGEKVPTGMTR